MEDNCYFNPVLLPAEIILYQPFHCLISKLWKETNCAYIFCMLQKTPFGYTRKDVLLIGLGVTVLGIGLKSGLEVPCFLL